MRTNSISRMFSDTSSYNLTQREARKKTLCGHNSDAHSCPKGGNELRLITGPVPKEYESFTQSEI